MRYLIALLSCLLMAAPSAAQEIACTGRDRVEALRTHDPAAYARYEAERNTIPNREGVYWKIEREGVAPSFLFGTMHSANHQLDDVLAPALGEIARARIVLTELGDMSGERRTAMALRASFFMLNFARDGLDVLPDEKRLGVIVDLLRQRKVPREVAEALKPWAIVMSLSYPLCESPGAGTPVVDDKVVATAKAAGVAVEALETIDEQMTAISAMDNALAGTLLSGLADKPGLIDDSFATLTALYRKREPASVLAALRHAFGLDKAEIEANVKMIGIIMGSRNDLMRDRSLPHIEKGGAFIAVGALHLPGEDGLVALLRDKGYRLTRID